MRLISGPASPEFYGVVGAPKEVLEWVRYTLPKRFRYFEDSRWYVHRIKILEIVQLAYSCVPYVDYSELDTDLQMLIAQEKVNWDTKARRSNPIVPSALKKSEAYGVLHLHSDAPGYIVRAVWKAVAKEHHPDRGGDAEKFKRYLEAYNLIKGTDA